MEEVWSCATPYGVGNGILVTNYKRMTPSGSLLLSKPILRDVDLPAIFLAGGIQYL